MNTVRIPIRYRKQLSRLTKDGRLFVFDSLVILASGENVELPDNVAGDLLELIWRDALMMENKNTKKDELAVGLLSVSPDSGHPTHPTPEVKRIEVKGSEENRSEVKTNTQKETFEFFWKLYPKKKAKPKAFEYWKKLTIDEPLFRRIIGSLEVQMNSADWQKESGKFIPYPQKWINEQRWLDEEVQSVQFEKPFNFNF